MAASLQVIAARAALVVSALLHPRIAWVRCGGLGVYVPRGVFNPCIGVSSLLAARLAERYARGVVLDLGCGSGFLGFTALLKGGAKFVVGVDVSPLAVATCRVNARLLGLEDRTSYHLSLAEAVKRAGGAFDTVLLNPPYLPCRPRLGFESAWCAGEGAKLARALVKASLGLLRPGGVLILAYSTLAGAGLPVPRRAKLLALERARMPWGEDVLAVALRKGIGGTGKNCGGGTR